MSGTSMFDPNRSAPSAPSTEHILRLLGHQLGDLVCSDPHCGNASVPGLRLCEDHLPLWVEIHDEDGDLESSFQVPVSTSRALLLAMLKEVYGPDRIATKVGS